MAKAKGSLTRKQLLKEPDQFITFSGRLITFGRTHTRGLLIAAGVLMAVVLIGVIVRQVLDRNERVASELTGKAMATYSAALQDTDPKTAFERVKTDFATLFDQYGSTRAAKIARIEYGDISYRAGDVDAAIAMYTQAMDDFGESSALRNIILSGLGYAYTLKRAYAEAIRYFEMISSGSDATLKGDAIFNMACLYALTGEKEKSLAMYKRLLADFPGSIYEPLAKEHIAG
ncbi:conserved hypothetical protein [Desulfosarcina cetonica]|uniref:tetratricopeptide repeat protein n=1 Tax=Desulfosarcina cetonica TaxID=90730 RepID=UPI0006D1B9F3|nr:tetratricopeptide repeat protein [Desulfosarcina cetonica]VTR68508.1 conserved hypothetical protein [Desulfosarcina cetonica]